MHYSKKYLQDIFYMNDVEINECYSFIDAIVQDITREQYIEECVSFINAHQLCDHAYLLNRLQQTLKSFF